MPEQRLPHKIYKRIETAPKIKSVATVTILAHTVSKSVSSADSFEPDDLTRLRRPDAVFEGTFLGSNARTSRRRKGGGGGGGGSSGSSNGKKTAMVVFSI